MDSNVDSNKEIFGWFYLDDVFCSKHEKEPSIFEAYYDKETDRYYFVTILDCKNKDKLLLNSREDLVKVLDKHKASFISAYPEISSRYHKMIRKVRKHKK